MTRFKLGNEEVDLLPFVREAIEALGYVKIESAPWLAEQIGLFYRRNNGRSIREAGSEWRLTLTEKGLQDPIGRFDATCSRAVCNAGNHCRRKQNMQLFQPGKRSIFVGCMMASPPSIGVCEAGAAMVGKLLPEPPELPFPGCDRDWCSCSWRNISRLEAEKLGF